MHIRQGTQEMAAQEQHSTAHRASRSIPNGLSITHTLLATPAYTNVLRFSALATEIISALSGHGSVSQ